MMKKAFFSFLNLNFRILILIILEIIFKNYLMALIKLYRLKYNIIISMKSEEKGIIFIFLNMIIRL